MDATGGRVQLRGVNWYGAEQRAFVVGGLDRQPLDAIADRITELGFNIVRLPFSNELVARNPSIRAADVAANPKFAGLPALTVLEAVVRALGRAGLLVALDNHISDAEWCCDRNDGNALWRTDAYPEAVWLDHWRTLATMVRDAPCVVAADLRNEPRGAATWGDDGPNDWRAAAERAAAVVHAVAPHWLIVVEGVDFAHDLRRAKNSPVRLGHPDRLVYAAHDYHWFHPRLRARRDLWRQLDEYWGGIDDTPVWLNEFGARLTPSVLDEPDHPEHRWLRWLVEYLHEREIDWAYWPLNATQSPGRTRAAGAPETYGLLRDDWWTVADRRLLALLLGE